MKLITLKPVKATPGILRKLEKKGLIIALIPTKRALNLAKNEDGAVDIIYKSAIEYGSHKLICVGKNATEIQLTTHPDNEEFLIIDQSKMKHKPLYIIIGLLKQREFEKKARSGKLSARDILTLEFAFNGPASVFTMLKGTPHCEITTPGREQHPVFFVTEPSNMTMDFVDVGDFQMRLK